MSLTVKPTWKQHLAYQAINTPEVEAVFLGGGAGGGKTWAICESRLINCYRYPGYKSFIARNELKRLMQSTYVTWIKVCSFHNIPREDWRFEGKYNYIEFVNSKTKEFDGTGSRIDFLDVKYYPVEDPLYERFGSIEYSDGALEEAGEIHPLAYDVLKSRLNRHLNKELGINPCMLLTGNPKKNWTYQTFYKPWKDGKLPESLRFIQSLWSDNPHTASDYGKTLAGIKDKTTKERLMNGNWEYEDDPAALMDYESISDIFTNTIEDDPEKYLTVDVARYGVDKTVMYVWHGWEVVRIIIRENFGTDQTETLIKDTASKEGIPRSHIAVDEDGIGGGVVDHVKGVRGFIANSSPIDIEPEQDEDDDSEYERETKKQKPNYANLKTQCAYFMAEKVKNHTVAVRTQNEEVKQWLTNDLEQVKEARVDSDAKRSLVPKDEVKTVLGRSPDFGDTFMMRAIFELKKLKRKIPSSPSTPSWVSKRWQKR